MLTYCSYRKSVDDKAFVEALRRTLYATASLVLTSASMRAIIIASEMLQARLFHVDQPRGGTGGGNGKAQPEQINNSTRNVRHNIIVENARFQKSYRLLFISG
jgi:hypothetical protein